MVPILLCVLFESAVVVGRSSDLPRAQTSSFPSYAFVGDGGLQPLTTGAGKVEEKKKRDMTCKSVLTLHDERILTERGCTVIWAYTCVYVYVGTTVNWVARSINGSVVVPAAVPGPSKRGNPSYRESARGH